LVFADLIDERKKAMPPLPELQQSYLHRVPFGIGSRVAHYGSAVLATTLAAVLTYGMLPRLGSTIAPLFFIGVLFAAWYGGLKPGLLCAALSAAACRLVFTQLPGPLSVGADDLLRLATFMVGAVFVSSLTTARREAEEAALEAEKQLSITLKSIGDAVITTDANGRITFMNLIAQSLTGWQQHEASGREIEEILRIVDPERGCEVETVATRVLRDNVVLGLGDPVYMVGRDGTEMPIDQIATPVRDSRGQINGIVLVLRNVPDPKPKDPARLLTETIGLLDAVDASMFAVDHKGRCAFVSKSAADLLGYQAHELVGKEIVELTDSNSDANWSYANQEWPELKGEHKRALLSNETMRRRDGTALPVESSYAPLIVGEQVVGTVITITDLTERQRAEEAITRLESIADSIDEAIITHTTDGIITSWNRAAERIYGYLEEEVCGRHVSIIHPPGYKQELQSLFARVLQQGRVEPFETVRVRKGGERVFVSINAVRLSDGSGPACLAQIVCDLTERKKNEEAAARAAIVPPQAQGRRRISEAATAGTKSRVGAVPDQLVPRTGAPRSSAVLMGRSAVMQRLLTTIDRVAPTDNAVLITGSTGTGKELVARAIHNKSLRSNGPFVDLNCSAIPETLIEAELFGHQRGTFTGAHENRPGLFEAASGGTLFLDEIDALPLAAQAKLLRVVQEKSIRRVGGRTNIDVDVRIISATNSELGDAITEGRFRSDLFYRLRVFPIQVPDLCHRENDIELLVDHFLQRDADQNGTAPREFAPDAMAALLQYSWPGNVRELESAVQYALAISSQGKLGINDLPSEFSVRTGETSSLLKETRAGYENDGAPLAEIEKRHILSVLQQFDGNQVRAAAALGIDRSKLYRRLRLYGVKAVKFLQEEKGDGMQLFSSRKDAPDATSEGQTGVSLRATSSPG
jgi:PAS domain S-box-containing protein